MNYPIKHPVPTNVWLIPPENFDKRKPNLVVYSSCHTWSLVPYLRHGRPDVSGTYNIIGVVVHLALDQQAWLDPRFAKVFETADVILHHPLDSDRWDKLRVREFKLKPSCRLISMESPQISCCWPVLSGLGESTVVACLNEGLNVDEIIRGFDAGDFRPDFASRFLLDQKRMRERDAEADIKSADFIFNYWQDVKMFSTINHPSFHVYVWMMDQLVGLLGFVRRGEEEALRVKTFAIEGDGHYPETEYEFQHYGFRYPRRYLTNMGGAGFYHREIRTIHERWKAGLTGML